MQAQIYPIKEWAKDDRPREKLRLKGAENLSDSELLAILIQNGIKKKSAIDLAREVLGLARNNLGALGKLSVRELMKVKGIGQAKAIIISAALELGRRREGMGVLSSGKPVVKVSADIASYLQSWLSDYQREVFGVVFLNRANRINHYEVISEGGITGTVADPRVILKKALEEDAVSIILFHNHPSGNLNPSRADEALTGKICRAAGYFDIRVLDHIIVSEEGYFSFADNGLIGESMLY
ncbi:MAG: DNA repair protein RadC [Chitinophagaceae bacterium]|nr:DNA repair protein RadC [Chitinophagaceae bacterium]